MKPKILYIYSDYKELCKKQNEVLKGFKEAEIIRINWEDDLTSAFNITSLPTFLFILNNKIIYRHNGSLTKEELIKILNKYENNNFKS